MCTSSKPATVRGSLLNGAFTCEPVDCINRMNLMIQRSSSWQLNKDLRIKHVHTSSKPATVRGSLLNGAFTCGPVDRINRMNLIIQRSSSWQLKKDLWINHVHNSQRKPVEWRVHTSDLAQEPLPRKQRKISSSSQMTIRQKTQTGECAVKRTLQM